VKRVLVADDEAAVTRLIQMRLEGEGYEVDVAPNGEVALDELAKHEYDVLVTDVCMPRMNGQQLVETLRRDERHAALRIFVLSSRPEAEFRSWTEQQQGVTFLEKPVSVNALLQRIREAAEPPEPAA